MVPKPTSLEMTICELVPIEQGSERISKINSFNALSASTYPFDPGRFFVHAVLTGSQGVGELMLVVTHLPTDQGVYASYEDIEFVDRFEEVRWTVAPSPFAFPQPGATSSPSSSMAKKSHLAGFTCIERSRSMSEAKQPSDKRPRSFFRGTSYHIVAVGDPNYRLPDDPAEATADPNRVIESRTEVTPPGHDSLPRHQGGHNHPSPPRP